MCARLLPSLISYYARWIVGAYVVALVPANIYILLKYPHLEKQVRTNYYAICKST